MTSNRLNMLRLSMMQALLYLALTVMGCNVFQGAQSGPGPGRGDETAQSPSPAPELGQPADTSLVVDTHPEDTASLPGEELAEPEVPTRMLDKYQVALLLPFLTNRYDSFDLRFNDISQWSMQYFMGTRLAAEKLSGREMELALSVHDTEGSPEVTGNLIEQSDLEDAHLIFGPYRRVTIQEVAQFARENEVNMVSPYSASSNLTTDNPHYIQAQPSMQTHCENLIRHALDHYRPDQIVLAGRKRDIDRSAFSFFQEGYYQAVGTRAAPGLTEYSVDSETADFEEIDISPFIDTLAPDTTVFLISAWTPEDETFVYSFLRKLELARQLGENGPADNTVVVYGTPVWMEYDRTPLDYFEKFSLHVSSNSFIDRKNSAVRDFERTFFQRFGLLPGEEAFLAYDLMTYFGQMLNQYGTRFEMSLEKEPFRGLHTQFNFQRVVLPGSRAEENPPIQQFENKFVHILRFRNYEFEPAPRAGD